MSDPLTNPSLAEEYRLPRPVEEIIAEKHRAHMMMRKQDEWLADLFARADAISSEDEVVREAERVLADAPLPPPQPKLPDPRQGD